MAERLNSVKENEVLIIKSFVQKETGGIEPKAVIQRLGGKLTQKELEREFAALRHMEKARGEKRGDQIVWRIW